MTDQKRSASRAIVLGASMAGLLTARVLAEAYDDVIVVERDPLTDHDCSVPHVCPRRGVPQDYHVHGLLTRGRLLIEEMFPGITDELLASGAVAGDVTDDVLWVVNGRHLPRTHSDMLMLSLSRPHLEQRVRARVRALPNVRFLVRHSAVAPLLAPGERRVVGVTVTDTAGTRDLRGDLVVDTTGWRSRTPTWLERLGYPEVEEERQNVGVGYATQYFRLTPDAMKGVISEMVAASPASPRGAMSLRIEGGRTVVTAFGFRGDHAPTDPEAYLAYLKSLSAPDIYETVRGQEPLADPVAFRFPYNMRRRYERLTDLPEGLLVLGDAVCRLNPIYGQGTTVAALETTVLRDHVTRFGGARPTDYFAAIAEHAVDDVWHQTTSTDLAFPGVEGERTEAWRQRQESMGELLDAAVHDPSLLTAYARVIYLMDPPSALAQPRIRRAVRAARENEQPRAGI
ncbi:NAD(P)/FAD-dependent oxidoreductase [Streptomyces zhaozhouensis]|nr:FAD-binding monooxygenase [Streptomyces zhaozhouensis]